MQPSDRRDVLNIDIVTAGGAAMLAAAQRRIHESGGELAVWGVLREHVYETRFGDGFYLHLRALAFDEADAHLLTALDDKSELTRWHVREYRLGIAQDAPFLITPWRDEEEFSINDFVEVLAEIPPGATASMLLTGSGAERRRPGSHMLSLE